MQYIEVIVKFCRESTYLLISGLLLILLAKDLLNQYSTEVQLANLKLDECQSHFEINRCHDPVPQVKEFCLEMEKCVLKGTAGGAGVLGVKGIGVIISLVLELINYSADQLSWKGMCLLGGLGFLFYQC
jgi:hypothetical protein